jgi:hypothetical protein
MQGIGEYSVVLVSAVSVLRKSVKIGRGEMGADRSLHRTTEMGTNGHDKPTKRDWAVASMRVTKYQPRGKGEVFLEIKKTLTKGGLVCNQSVIINLHQLAGLARDFLS